MSEVWQTITDEFADLDTRGATQVVVRLLMATLLAGLLGLERSHRGKGAGLRTHMLVGAGAALFVLVPQRLHWSDDAVSRVLQGLLAGIGFLGAGAILHLQKSEEIHGLTTAANIWVTAAIGTTVGLGREATAVLATLLALAVLELMPLVERVIPHEGLRRNAKGKQ